MSYKVSTPVFASKPRKVRLRSLARGALSVTWGDRETYVVVRGWGGTLTSPHNRRGIRLPRRHYIHTTFSPGLQYLALADQRKRLMVMSVKTGRVVTRHSRGEAPKWINATTLGFRSGCTGMSVDVSERRPTPITIGRAKGPCRKVVHVSDDYATWTIADHDDERRGRMLVHTALRTANLATGEVTTLRSTSFMAPRFSPRGDRRCWLEDNADLRCSTSRVASVATSEKIWSNVQRPIRFDDTGRRLLFTVGERREKASNIFVVDFEARTIDKLPRAGREWWLFLAGGTRIAGHGGSSSGLVYDLPAKWSAAIGDATSEWEGLWPVTQDRGQLAIGRERGGGRDLFHATIRD